MTLLSTVQQHPASVDAYIRHGWSLVPVPSGTKGPQHQGWNQRSAALQSHTQLPQGWGIGLAHAYSGTMAVDIDNWTRASFELMMHGINLQGIYDAPDAVIVDSGRQGHGKLLYAMPFGLSLPSKKLMDTDARGKRYNYLDLRCGTANGLTVQDVLPPSIHPDTNQPYRWAGKGHWSRLPVIPQPLLTFWMDSLKQDQHQQIDEPVSADWNEIRDALQHVSPDCSREEWITVGMALHYAGTATNTLDYAAQLWDQWSQPSSKYPGAKDLATQWRSFRADKSTKVRLGSLFKLARAGGWQGVTIDASQLFTGVQPTAPAQLTSDLRPPPPQIDMDLVPATLRRRSLDIAEGVGCDPMIPLFAGLAAVSGAIDARSRLELKPGYKVPPILWVMTIGEPADKKSPGSKIMFRVLEQLEKEDRPRYAKALQQYEGLAARHEMARKAFLDAAKDPEALLSGEIPQGYGDPPPEPAPLKILTIDSTSQKLVRQCATNPRGLLLYMDEMLSWTRKLTDRTSGETRSAWTQAYEAERYEMDRVGAGTINAENFAVSVYGNLQPQVFADVVTAMSEDGLLQRFLPVVVRQNQRRKGVPLPAHDTSEADYNMMVRTVFGLPAMTYTLSAGASQVFDQFQDWYEQRMDDERLVKSGPVFMTALGKFEGLVGRLTLIWHVMTSPFTTQVSTETMEQVVEFVRGYVIDAIRYAFDTDLGGVSNFDQWVADYVIQYADQPSLTLSDVKQSARRQFKGVNTWTQDQMVIQAMYPLEKAGWVARMDDGSRLNQHHAQWAINPTLNQQFADHRRKVIEAKQRMMDHIYRDAVKRKPQVHGAEKVA